MAEVPAIPPKPKKGGSLFKKKVAGLPLPVVLVGGGLGLYLVYRYYKSHQAASTSSIATPTASSGTTPDQSGGYMGSGGGYSGASGGGSPTDTSIPGTTETTTPLVPTGTGPTTPTGIPATTLAKKTITPIGSQVITVGGRPFSTVSGFIHNGSTYYGINNPAEAKQLEQLGVTLVHNPNDPSGKGLFVMKPAGAKTIPRSAPTPAGEKRKVATGTRTGTGAGYAGTGATNSVQPPPAAARAENRVAKRNAEARVRNQVKAKP